MLVLLLIGAIVGIFSGFFGIGGGIILVPVLKYYYEMKLQVPHDISMQLAVATSLTIIIFTTATSAYNYFKNNQVDLKIFYYMTPSRLFGIAIGALIVPYISGNIYPKLFAFLLIFVGLKLLLTQSNSEETLSGTASQAKLGLGFQLFSMMSGLLSSLFGIGGGIVNTPYFLHLKLNMKKAIGTNTLCTLPGAIVGAALYAFTNVAQIKQLHLSYVTGLIDWQSVINISITGIIFSPLGVKLALATHPKLLKQLFGLVLIAIALKMFF